MPVRHQVARSNQYLFVKFSFPRKSIQFKPEPNVAERVRLTNHNLFPRLQEVPQRRDQQLGGAGDERQGGAGGR